MTYVFDTGPLIDLFEHYYEARFPSLWAEFDGLVSAGRLLSVREASKEIEAYYKEDRLKVWATLNRGVFEQSTEAELAYVSEIFKVPHFLQMIESKKILEGRPVADPFVIARARAISGCVVTTERLKPNAAKIPNVCEHFGIDCTNLEGFMEREGWSF